MKLTKKLAYSQLMARKRRTVWTLIGIILSVAMITAVYGFSASIYAELDEMLGDDFNMRSEFVTTIVGIGAVLSVVIISASVIVVSNAFRVSAGERLTQFGILKSVGATKRQIAATVMHEGVLLSAIGVPAGIIFGSFVQLACIRIANHLLAGIIYATPHLRFVIAWQAILAAIGVSFVTVMLSAWFPARKAAKISAIDAIRGAGEVKIKTRQVRSNWLVRKLFGFEGTLASKSMGRSKRNFRATVVSLAISIIMVVASSSFGAHLNRMADLVIHTVDANVIGSFYSSMHFEGYSYFLHFTPIGSEKADMIARRLRNFPDTKIFGAGSNLGRSFSISTGIPAEMLTRRKRDFTINNRGLDPMLEHETLRLSINLVTADAENYAELARLAGVPLGSNILLNYSRRLVDERWTEFEPLIFTGQTLMRPQLNSDELYELPLHGVLSGEQIPNELLLASGADITVLVPQIYAASYHWYAQTEDVDGLVAYMFALFDELFPWRDDAVPVNTNVRNLAREQNSERAIIQLVMIFVYGFVGMLTLIGLTNVISTISTNVRSRSREFAVLRSVGMTHSGLGRMLNLESILCSAKSLIIGLPLGVAASYLIYQAILFSADFPYTFPWLAIAQCVIGVFIVTWVTMHYSASRLRGGNIVENIREKG